ncbi:MAG: biopolymer transporter ExbD [Paracoccus sp. (in: a-proteobacteria)]|nr:biopolymer transporter ExbD [Paracoccus sp. (in: a-proteobacteria)]
MAATATRFRLNLERSRRRRRFSMTPLADVMFQLLIFFMLSADVLPYSLLTVQSGGLQGEAGADTVEIPGTAARTTAVWTLDSTEIISGGQRFTLDRAPDLAGAMTLHGTPDLLLVVRPSVDIQTLARVLEVLESRGIHSVQIADGGL